MRTARAVGTHAAHVRVDQQAADESGVLGFDPGFLEAGGDEVQQAFFLHQDACIRWLVLLVHGELSSSENQIASGYDASSRQRSSMASMFSHGVPATI